MRPWIRRYRFYWIFAPGGRLNYEAYNVDTKSQSLKTIQKTLTNTKINKKTINNKKQQIKDHSNTIFNKNV